MPTTPPPRPSPEALARAADCVKALARELDAFAASAIRAADALDAPLLAEIGERLRARGLGDTDTARARGRRRPAVEAVVVGDMGGTRAKATPAKAKKGGA